MKRRAPPSTETSSPSASSSAAHKRSTRAPDYGSKSYWEARYKSHRSALAPCANDTNDTPRVVDGVELSDEAIRPGHAWYFTYDELRPLILPLILGEADADEEEGLLNRFHEEEEEDSREEASSEGGDANASNASGEEDEPPQDEGEEERECEDIQGNDVSDGDQSDDESIDPLESHLKRPQPLSSPKSILEIGCGDVPLGSSLTSELNRLQSSTGCDARTVVSHVTCIDYSEAVIEILIRKLLPQKERRERLEKKRSRAGEQSAQHPPIRPTYAAIDARSLPYPSNSYSVILEKGTMDAMLSHPTEGISNSILIMKEMARVCAVNGAILIVSHLNARCEKGMGWVENVVMKGLREEWAERRKRNNAEKKKNNDHDSEEMEILWSIEVHSGEAIYKDDTEDGEVEEGAEGPSYGPAVYILKKKGLASSIVREVLDKKRDRKRQGGDGDGAEEEEEEEMPPVKLEFLTYS